MKINVLTLVCWFLLVASCQQSLPKERRILIDSETYAEGSISADTTYQGFIKFTDRQTGNLITTATYKNGVLNGEKIDFYPDGRMKSLGSYEKGKLNGYVSFFGRSGNVNETEYYYYDLIVGPRTKYENGLPKSYKFYSLENELLFEINYDSVRGNSIEDLQKRFFYFNKRDFTENENGSDSNNRTGSDYFIYTISPPRFNFEYDIVEIDSLYKIKSVIKRLKNNKPWDAFTLYRDTIFTGYKAIRLNIRDSINDIGTTMLKRL